MPVQKGKRRRSRIRNRPSHYESGETDNLPTVDEKPKRAAKPVMRRGWNPPLWVNLMLGVGMAVFGIFFFVLPQKGMGSGQRLLLLVGYFLVAGFYLFRAYRQYRQRQET